MEPRILTFDTLTDVIEDLDARGIQGVQRYKAVNGYISLKARYRDIPVSGTFELTPFCNLDCKMCYVHLMSNQIGKNERLLSVEEWKTIIRQAVDAGMMYATLTGGECLTYYGFKDIYLYLMSLGIHPDVLTNGRLLTEDMIRFFAAYPPGIMQISLYGSSEDAYEKVTGHRAFHQVLEGIMRAKQAGLNISLAITPNRYMKEDMLELLDLVHSLKIPYAIGGVTLQARPETQREILEYAMDTDAYFELQRAERKYLNDLPRSENMASIPQYFPKATKVLQGLPCGGAHSSFHVNWKGELCPCIAFSATVHYDILEQGFEYAWKLVRDAMKAYKEPKECTGCTMRDFCSGCPGEKCMSDLNGELNRDVCEKLERYLEEVN